jgi:cytochrome c2
LATHILKHIYSILKVLLIIFLFNLDLFGNNFCTDCHKKHYEDIGNCESCHRGISETKRKDLAHFKLIGGKHAEFLFTSSDKKNEGIDLINKSGCRRCHNIGNKGNKLSADLNSSIKSQTIKTIVDAIENPSEFMPNFHFTADQIDSIVTALLYFVYVENGYNKNIIQVAHISYRNDNIYEKKCGGCHKMISSIFGPVGSADIAPNLSGLLTDFYPWEIAGKKWNEQILSEWIKNPRSILKNALMPIVILSDDELEKVLKYFVN